MVDAVGGLIEFWGFKRHLGRVWALLYFEARPLSAGDLQRGLSMSAGAVSMTLSDLLRWGVVKKTWLPGERRDFYEPETSIWKMVSRVFRERELRQIQTAIEAFDRGIAELERERDEAAAPADAARAQFVIDRVQGLLTLARIGDSLLRAMLSGEAIDATPLKSFLFPGHE
jgi:DNA-binding transcriptional regulator GbsR (MarR family)